MAVAGGSIALPVMGQKLLRQCKWTSELPDSQLRFHVFWPFGFFVIGVLPHSMMTDLFILAQAESSVPVLKLMVAGALGAVAALLAGYLLTIWLGRKRVDSARTESER